MWVVNQPDKRLITLDHPSKNEKKDCWFLLLLEQLKHLMNESMYEPGNTN
jgi:hypothetical protein